MHINLIKKKLTSPWVIVLVGTPLAGKSSFIKNFSDEEFVLISSDDLVMELYDDGSGDYNKAWENANFKFINKMLRSTFEEASENGQNVIVDFMNLTRKRRRSNLRFFKDYYKMCVVFPILSDEEYAFRNEKRTREEKKTISETFLNKMIEGFQPVLKDEGFDSIIML